MARFHRAIIAIAFGTAIAFGARATLAVAAPPEAAQPSSAPSAGLEPQRAPLPEASIVLRLLRLEPARAATVNRRRPEISATFSEPIDPATARVSVDGSDVSVDCYLAARSFVYEPAMDLVPGSHEVVVDGRTPAQETFHERWSFNTSEPLSPNYLSGLEPASGAKLGGASIEISGFTRPRARVRVVGTTSNTSPNFGVVTDGSTTADTVATWKGSFSALLPVVDRGSGLLDVRIVSTAADGSIAVKTLRLRR